ncbi:MAG: FAD binding domain-containing protein [Chloroflexi bacterium]|nr:FAD binding domain-containing protein [Chloroflexota bacterium]
MKPAPFRYLRPTSLDEALDALATLGDEAKPIAGGQSLVPMLNFRLARPGVLIDLGRIPALTGVHRTDGSLRIGAMTRQRVLELDQDIADRLPVLRAALRHVGHVQIRTRGTIGGSLAHADAAAELPALALALDATVEVASVAGTRTVAAADLFLGPWTTCLAPDELLTRVDVPLAWQRAAIVELARRHGDFALAGVVGARRPATTDDAGIRLVGFGVGWTPVRLTEAEAALAAGGSAEVVADAAAAGIDPIDDIHADAAWRRDGLRALVTRIADQLGVAA